MSNLLCVGNHGDEPPEAESGYLCLDCYKALRKQLEQLPAVAAWLEINIAAGGSGLRDKVTGSSEDPIPLRVDVTDLVGPVGSNPTAAMTRDEFDQLTWEALDQAGETSLFDEARSWAQLVKDETGATWTGDDRHTLIGAVTFLLAHLHWIAAQAWVDEFASVIARLHRDAQRVAPWRARLQRTDEPCSHCDVRALVIHLGEGFTRCEKHLGGCGRREKLTEYEYRILLPESRKTG